jgi:hypothetical protein
MRPTAGKAALRPAQNVSRSASEVEMRQVVEPFLAAIASTSPNQMIDLGRRAVEFHDQQRLDIERVACMDKILGRVDRRPVHHLHAAGDDARADDVGDALAALLAGRETDQKRSRRLRLFQDAHGDLGDDAKQTFRAGHDAEQVIAFGVEMLAAKPHHLAIDQHHFDAEHIVGGEAVFQAMHAAGIFRDVAADRTGDLRRRVGARNKSLPARPHA